MSRKVFIIEDHDDIRTVYRRLIEREPDFGICGEAGHADQVLSMLDDLAPDVIMLDLHIPGTRGVDLIKAIKNRHPEIPILVVSGQDDPIYVKHMLHSGASGYLDKLNCIPQLVTALHQVADGAGYLDERILARESRP